VPGIGSVGLLAIVLASVLSAGCSWHPDSIHDTAAAPARPAAADLPVGERAATIALEQVGAPYRYGGETPAGFDCSGLVHYAYAKTGKRVPRTTGELWAASSSVPLDELRAGDLLFFAFSGKLQHVGLYVGEGRFAHAPSAGRTVSVESLSASVYRRALLRAGRLR
jgi:cell wall-associated NlpC family hydrolase